MSDTAMRRDLDVGSTGAESEKLSRDQRALSRLVAVTVILLSVFMAITKVKDDNIVQTMQQTKTEVVDTWAEYQANKLKQHLADQAAGQDRVMETIPGIDTAALREHQRQQVSASEKYQARAGELMAKARAGEQKVEQLGRQDDQFDMSDALLAMALAITAAAILAESYVALVAGWILGGAGVLMGIVGFIGGSFRIEWLINLLN